jgi:hypothetical protein
VPTSSVFASASAPIPVQGGEQRPVERADAQEAERQEVRERPRQSVREPARREQTAEGRHARDPRGPLHQPQVAEAEPIPRRKQEWVEQARATARVPVAGDPLEREAARRRAREIEMDEDIV